RYCFTEPPKIDENDFDEFLATDDLFVDYFNAYLELPSFPEPLRFNTNTGAFEVLTPDKFKLADKIKSLARSKTPISKVYKVTCMGNLEKEKEEENKGNEEIKTSFSVKCLDKEQGMQWIKRFRLPTFLRSELYMEYRLAKLLSQIETRSCGIKLTIDPNYRPWHKEKKITPPPSPVDETSQMIEKLKTQQWYTMAKEVSWIVETVSVSDTPRRPAVSASLAAYRRKSSTRPISSLDSRSDIADDADDYFSRVDSEVTTLLTLYHKDTDKTDINKNLIGHFTECKLYIKNLHYIRVIGHILSIVGNYLGKTKLYFTVGHVVKIEPEISDDESDQGVGSESDENKQETNPEEIENEANKKSKETDSVFSDETDESDFTNSSRRFDFADANGFSKFKSFLHNTIGENLLMLWMDIDKSRFGMNHMKKQLYLQKLRKKYLKIGSTKRLPKESLASFQLQLATQWRIDHLHQVQHKIAESLLLYWAPRYLVRQTPPAPSILGVHNAVDEDHKVRDIRPLSSQSYPSPKTMTIAPLRPKSCFPRFKYLHRDVIRNQHDPSPPLTTPSPIPSYLTPKVAELTEKRSPLIIEMNCIFFSQSGKMMEKHNFRMPFSQAKPTITIRSSASSATSQVTIKGSPAMESMLQALYHDTKAGWFFTQFCEQSGNQVWNNAIHFWFDVQEFHHLFYADIFDKFTVEQKAQVIYSTYIVGGACEDIGVSIAMRKQIRLKLTPAFDELFDRVEEQVLKILIIPWNQMLGSDQASYSKIELINQERNLNVAPRYLGFLQKKGIINEVNNITHFIKQESIEKYEEDLWLNVPEEFRNFSFDELIRNRIELEFFRKFLEENFAKNDLLCWLDIEAFKRVSHSANEKRDEKAKEIRAKYLHKKYFFGPNSPATKDEQNQVVMAAGGWGKTLKERPPNELITGAQKYVRQRIEKRWLPLFLATEDFQDRQRPKSQMSEVADDVILQRKKKRGEPWRLLDNRWQSSSRDLMEFRRGLTNKITASQFRKYVSLKGEFLENNVLFWLEVQKYKDFCHIHNDLSAIEAKVISIVNCFINSHIPPSLQIDISTEMAEKILEKWKEMGPYVFREAQVSILRVFRVLFTHWNGFCEFRKNLSDEKISSTLERQRKKRMERIKKQIKEQEEEALLRVTREADTLDLPDILSTKGSEIAESLMSDSRHNQLTWSYGKHIEGLERQRHLLLMENEVKGRI
uniref:RGS domain-containing protein n=1 Tax=Ciona savignyi TaxID=51511 RepID=H2Z5E4_CIOSA